MKKRRPLYLLDKDGEKWVIDQRNDGELFDSAGFMHDLRTVERRWGPLVPVYPSWWKVATATWQARLFFVLLCGSLIGGIITGIIRFSVGDTGWDLLFTILMPAIVVAGFAVIVIVVISILTWVFPDLTD